MARNTKTVMPEKKDYLLLKAADRTRYQRFHKELCRAEEEEDVKISYINFFNLDHDTTGKRDLYTPEVLYEFKFDKNMKDVADVSAVLAQILYYVRRLKYGDDDKSIPPYLCLADVNETVLTQTANWMSYVDNDKYDWTFAPSSPDSRLVADLTQSDISSEHVYNLFDVAELSALDTLMASIYSHNLFGAQLVKKDINERNFESVYDRWNAKFGEAVRNGFKPSVYFICDIQEGKTNVVESQSRVVFMMDDGGGRWKKINLKDYRQFWQLYNKTRDIRAIQGIRSKADRLSDDFERRFEGEFYTPIPFAEKAIDYLGDVIGGETHQIDWASGKYRLWDMACGSGNLEYNLPAEAYPYCYLSTLRTEDKRLCERLFRGATVFQYDYLHDDVDNVMREQRFYGWKMPQKLVDDLADPNLQWIVFLNPPFATAQNQADPTKSKKDVSMTPIRGYMTADGLGETSRELAAQFLYRINHEFRGKHAWLGLFNKIKYINANNDAKLRQKVFYYHFEKGFIFAAHNFAGITAPFPIGFLVWNLGHEEPVESQHITVDMLDDNAENFGSKQLFTLDRKLFLNNWIERPKTTTVFPPFSSALNINANKTDLRDRISPGFLCSLCTNGNDIQHLRNVALFSGPYGSAGALSVTRDNFLKAMIIHAVKKTYKGEWYDDRDQFYQPYRNVIDDGKSALIFSAGQMFPLGYAYDCVVWSLFSYESNQTVAMSDVSYKGVVYQIRNNLFPFTRRQVGEWGIEDMDIANTILIGNDDRFAATWLQQHRHELSDEAVAVVEAAASVYKMYFLHLNSINTTHYKITTWDAGLYQVRHGLMDAGLGADCLKALADANGRLADKIRSRVRELGFMR